MFLLAASGFHEAAGRSPAREKAGSVWRCIALWPRGCSSCSKGQRSSSDFVGTKQQPVMHITPASERIQGSALLLLGRVFKQVFKVHSLGFNSPLAVCLHVQSISRMDLLTMGFSGAGVTEAMESSDGDATKAFLMLIRYRASLLRLFCHSSTFVLCSASGETGGETGDTVICHHAFPLIPIRRLCQQAGGPPSSKAKSIHTHTCLIFLSPQLFLSP
jgi:hypothetical protein